MTNSVKLTELISPRKNSAKLAEFSERQRTSIHFALQAVARRLECEVFRAAYDRMERAARELYQITPSS